MVGGAGVHGEAFVVCVDEYDGAPHARLESARRCAEDFRALARRLGFDADSPVISGTKQEIDEALDVIRRSPARRKLVYWVGHGFAYGRNRVGLPSRDFDLRTKDPMFYPHELGRFLIRLSGDVLFIVDTCHAADFAYDVYKEYVELEVAAGILRPGPPGAGMPGRSIGCLGTVAGDDLAQVGLWLGAWRRLVDTRDQEFREEPLWNAYARAVHGAVVLEAVHHVLADTAGGDRVTPQLHGGNRLLGFFVNPHYDPSARPVSAAAPTRRQELLGEQVQRLLRGRFAGLLLEEDDVPFVGRRHSLARITEWLTSSGRNGIMGVTGAPGSGKSALLGQIALMTIKDTPQFRALPPGRRSSLAGAISAGIQCRGRSALECARELALGMQIPEPEAGWKDVGEAVLALIAACRAEGEAAFLVDGLDETDPAHLDALVTEVLGPLGQQPNVRILVGTRPTAGQALALLDATTHDLDTVHDRADDIAEYVTHRLSGPDSPYRADAGLREAVARVLVEQSQGVFLVARLHCVALVRSGRALAADGEEFRGLLAAGLEEALEQEVRDLDRVASAGPGGPVPAGWARGLLLPLALSYGAGLPHADDIWLDAARRLADADGRTVAYSADDIRRIRRVAGAHVVEYGEAGQPVYRLGHEALAHHLLAGTGRTRAELHAVMTDVLLHRHRAVYRGRGATNAYIARYVTAHADACGRLTELAEDAEFLVNAEPERLIRLLDRPGAAATERTELYRRVAEELTGRSPAGRSALLQATALYQQPELRAWARSPELLFWTDEWTTTRPVPPFRTLKVPQGDVRAVAADGDGRGLLAAGERLWHWPRPGGRPVFLHRWLGSGAFHALTVAPLGTPVTSAPLETAVTAVADAERVVVWTSESGPVQVYGWGSRIGDVAAGSAGGTALVVAASGTTVSVWEWRDGRPHHRGFWPWPGAGPVQSVAVGALDGLPCVLAAGDGGAVVWDARTGERLLAFGADGGRADALAATVSDTGLHVAVLGTARPQVRVWRVRRVADGAPPGAELMHTAALRHASGSAVALRDDPEGLLVAAVDGGAVRLWRVRHGARDGVGDGPLENEELPALPGHRTQPRSVAFLRDDEGSVCVADGSRIRVWQPAAGAPGSGAAGGGPRTGMPSSGSGHVGAMTGAAGGGGGAVALAAENTVRVWDLGGRHLADDRVLDRVSSLALRGAPGGDETLWLAVGGHHPVHGPCLRVRTLADEAGRDFRLDVHRDSSVTAVALAGDGGAVQVLAATDRYIRRWDVTGGEQRPSLHVGVGRIEHLTAVETSGAEPFVAATAGDSVWVWPGAEPGIRPLRFRLPRLAHPVPARALAATHDAGGRPLVAVATSAGVFTGSLDDPLEDGTGRRWLRLRTEVADVRSLAFCATAAGRLVLLGASRTRIVHEWAVDGPGEDRVLPDRGFDVHQVFAAPAASGLLVAAVGRERMDVLRLDERRG
ncbi:hypothetical protein [Streptomyces sp. NPDC003943]